MRKIGLLLTMLLISIAGKAQDVDTTELLQQVNKMRAEGCKCGNIQLAPVAPLVWNETLASAATDHSIYMAGIGELKHQGADGSKAGDRVARKGYSWRTYGENVAMGPSTVNAVIELWKNSPSHCKNIMNPVFTQVGLGKAGKYWTQVFATPK